MIFRSKANTTELLCLFTVAASPYIPNMVFENNLAPEPTLRTRIVDHLPIAIAVAGLLAVFVSLHVAATGLIMAALAHVLIGVVLLVVRRHRTKDQAQPDTIHP